MECDCWLASFLVQKATTTHLHLFFNVVILTLLSHRRPGVSKAPSSKATLAPGNTDALAICRPSVTARQSFLSPRPVLRLLRPAYRRSHASFDWFCPPGSRRSFASPVSLAHVQLLIKDSNLPSQPVSTSRASATCLPCHGREPCYKRAARSSTHAKVANPFGSLLL